ncbi:Endo-1,4-beta-xylanase A precursor [compost metagenome]
MKAGEWYSDAIATAQALGIVNGYEDGSFGLDRAITREEMAVLVKRLLTAAGVDLQKTRGETVFHDASQMAGYAADAVKTLNEAGIMEGQGVAFFAPKSPTLRAEAAVLIARMMGLE